MAEKAIAYGEFGASTWPEHHRLQMSRIESLLELIDDAAVPTGTLIQLLPTVVFGRLAQSLSRRSALDGVVEAIADVD